MVPSKKQVELSVQEANLYQELDKGINDMKDNQTICHDEAMRQIRESLENYVV